ncbi:YciI family protein [Sutcliffiella horikoshii]|uniref:YciI family protein n=1 Tax=Sutcliffiella horikoshii TaxID=79883 RepID=UPI00384BC15F
MSLQTYIYLLRLPERLYDPEYWTEEEKTIVSRHFTYLKKNVDSGVVILAGRTEQTDETGFGTVIFLARNETEAERFMNNDPAVSSEIMTAELSPYRLALMNEKFSIGV